MTIKPEINTRDRRWMVRQSCSKAIAILRQLEDWARLDAKDDVLAGRIRECHEEITTRVLNGRVGRGLSRKQLEQALEYFGG